MKNTVLVYEEVGKITKEIQINMEQKKIYVKTTQSPCLNRQFLSIKTLDHLHYVFHFEIILDSNRLS